MKERTVYQNAKEYWEDMYRRQRDEIPEDEYERKMIEGLGEGKSITEIFKELQKELGLSIEECMKKYEGLRYKCNEWEKNNMLYIDPTGK